MELDMKVDDMFNAVAQTKPPKGIDNANVELKKIEHQMNLHLKNKQGQKFKKVSIFNFDDKTNYDEHTFSKVVDLEIETKYMNKKFASLPMYMKWNMVQAYLRENNIEENAVINHLKETLCKGGDSIVTYDHINKKVTNIALD